LVTPPGSPQVEGFTSTIPRTAERTWLLHQPCPVRHHQARDDRLIARRAIHRPEIPIRQTNPGHFLQADLVEDAQQFRSLDLQQPGLNIAEDEAGPLRVGAEIERTPAKTRVLERLLGQHPGSEIRRALDDDQLHLAIAEPRRLIRGVQARQRRVLRAYLNRRPNGWKIGKPVPYWDRLLCARPSSGECSR
jgi:hypothetical protein